MAEKQPVNISGARAGDEPEDVLTDEMKVYVDVLGRELDEEFKIAERLDAKARGYLAATTVVVAGTQAAAVALVIRLGGIPGAIAALGSLIVLAMVGKAIHRVLIATRTRESSAFDVAYARTLLPFAYHGRPVVVHNLADVLLRTLEDRRRANRERQRDVDNALDAAKLASVLLVAELAVIIVVVAVDGVT